MLPFPAAQLESAPAPCVVRVSEANGQIREALGSGLRIVENELPSDRAAFRLVRVIHALNPVKGPCGLYRLRLDHCVIPQCDGVVMPHLRHSQRAAAVTGGDLVEVGLRRVLGIVQRIEVDEDRANHPVPVLSGGNVGVRAPAIVAGGPVNLNGVIRPHAKGPFRSNFSAPPPIYSVLWVNQINSDVVFGAGEAPRGMLVHDAAVSVLVLDGVLIDAGFQDGLLLAREP